ncbi:MAG: S8 family serine peptidase [Phycisphaerales bacterium]|nr:S8 family serine peptidase [Phycisphaerales bacterium]
MRRSPIVLVFILAGCSSSPTTPGRAAMPAPATTPPAAASAASTEPVLREYQPKIETGAAEFLSSRPDADGRGIVVAIFDQGVDPGAPGLQVTTEGHTKIVDLVDGTGSGDVDTSTVREASEEGTIEGLTGRTLHLPTDWTNTDGQWRVGIKSAWDLFPGDLVSRMKKERRKEFDIKQRALEADAATKLEAFRRDHEEETDDERREREELEARLEHLRELAEGYDDPGPVYDCIVFHDGEHWRGVIDRDEDGDLSDEVLLEDYRIHHHWSTFGTTDLMNYGINVYEEGDVLSIVVDSGSHGTHVAGTVAAHFPGQPELDGIAPGAGIVSVKIGDSRLGSTSLGTGEVRGLIAVLRNRCDLINMSYGGSTGFPNHGRIINLYRDIVNEHGVIFVASAGNSGPNLTTVGTPGGTTTEVIGVGAMLTPEMMRDQYSFREPYDSLHYTWSSRGPASDGDLGVDISGPGGAVSPMPVWTLKRHSLKNGTSMSSPNVCGSLALLCSGLKEEGRTWTPHLIRRAIMNTARPVPGMDRFSLGAGLIDVPAAWDWLAAHGDRDDADVRLSVRTSGRHAGRGIYLRESWENNQVATVPVTISPIFPRDADRRRQAEYELSLRFESTADWIDVPQTMLLVHGGKRFDVRVDPTGLEPGNHFAEVLIFDASESNAGPIARLPVTVLRPVHLEQENDWTMEERVVFAPGEIRRWYLDLPQGTTWVDVQMQRQDASTKRTLVVHATQLEDGRAYSDSNVRKYVRFEDDDRALVSIPAIGGRTMELAIAQYWSSLEEGEVDVTVSAHGLVPEADPIVLDGNRLFTTMDVRAPLGPEELDPSGSFTFVRSWLQSTDRRIEPLSRDRDELPEGRLIHELVSTYEFTLKKDASVRLWEQGLEYSRDYESTMILVFDDAKKLVLATVDDDFHKLSKGTYTVLFHVRHDESSELERLEDLPLCLDRRLSSSISLKIRSHPDQVMTGSGTYADRILRHGESAPLYIAAPSVASQNKAGEPGDLLVGTMSFGSGSSDTVGAGENPDGWPLAMTIAESAVPTKKPGSKDEEEDESSTRDDMEEAMADVQVRHLLLFDHETERPEFEALVRSRLSEDPADMDVLAARLTWTEQDETLEDDDHRRAMLAAADAIIEAIDLEELAAWRGREHDGEEVDEDEVQRMKEAHEHLVAALMARGRVQLEMAEAGDAPEATDAFNATWNELDEWSDPADEEGGWKLELGRARMEQRLATALELVDARLKKHPRERELHDIRLELLEALEWNHLAEGQRRAMLLAFPGEYPPL